ncbi:MAG TPA: glycosyltransferase family A protein, partial [Verrucomicrobiae bacterium]|nr:glycosyltransferase family A protein [Verrucomicrobiae bacterium]
MSPAPRVTVAIPTWNWSKALRCSIPTVLHQTFADFELLVIGDGCTDDSAEVVASFSDPRIHWHNLPQNIGNQSGPNNAALDLAKGEFIAYLGHDDLWLPDHLESLVKIADQTTADVVAAGILLLGPKDSGLRMIGGFLPADPSTADPISVPPSALLHRLDAGRAIGGWNPPDDCVLAPDMDFLKRLWEYRRRVACTGRLSVIKINAAWRSNSYITRDTSEHEEWLQRITDEENFRENVLHEILGTLAAGTLGPLGPILAPPADWPKGWSASQTRRIRGVSGQAVGTEPIKDGVRFTAEHPGLGRGFYFPEFPPDTLSYRWTGPSTQSIGEFTGVPPDSNCVRIRLSGALAEDQLAIGIKINGATVPLERENHPPGAVFAGRIEGGILASGAARMELTAPRVIRPRDLSPDSPDHRSLGVRFCWIEFLHS